MKLGCNDPIGPLTLADVMGLDVSTAVMQTIHMSSIRNTDPNYSFYWCGRGDLNSHVLSDNRF